jgi:outer membrane protein TolC
MKFKLTTLAWLLGMIWSSVAISQPDTHPVLQGYIQQALDSNLVLRQKHIALHKSMLALQEARSYFLPSINFSGSYTLAAGGRDIYIPVGDLLNPVYATLNQLTGTTKFPTVSNVEEQLLPNNFYDAKVRTTYPLFNPDIRYNRDIKQQQIQLSEGEIAIYKRELIKDVKTAYYTYLLATRGIEIYESTRAVVERSLRTNQSLLVNGKGLPAYVSRSEADLQQVEAQIENARNEAAKARAYFNFLLNRPLQDSIVTTEPALPALAVLQGYSDSLLANREELKQLQTAESINRTAIAMNEAYWKPRVNLFADLGMQAFEWKVNDQSPYYMAGVQLEFPIFQGKRNQYRIEQSKKDLEQIKTQQNLVNQQLGLQAFTAKNNVLTAFANYKAAQKQVQASTSYFKLIDRGRTEGTNSFIEWLDARNQYTTVQLQEQLTKYRTLIAWADYERQTAAITINN